jgi:hypothetical protein
MPRRDAFSKLRSTAAEPSSGEKSPIQSSQDMAFQPSSIQPLDFIPLAEPRKKRERKWEKDHQVEIATYRGIPPEMHQTLIRLSDHLGVPVDEVARALIEFSLQQIQTGLLPIHPQPKAQRMTLFPTGQKASSDPSQSWLREAFPTRKYDNKNKKGGLSKAWEARVTYRLAPSLKQEVKRIANTHTVAIGELVYFFFLHALKAFEAGELKLETHPKVSGNTLF